MFGGQLIQETCLQRGTMSSRVNKYFNKFFSSLLLCGIMCDSNMPCNSYSYTSDDGTCSLAFLKKDQFMEKEVQDADNTNIFLNGNTKKADVDHFTSILEGLFYVGCYNYSSSFPQDLELGNEITSSVMTLRQCIKHCRGLGKSYGALDKGRCWCSDLWPLESLQMSDSLCPDKCRGEPGAGWTCGGWWRISVYSLH